MWTVFFTIAISLGAFESAAQIEFLGQRSMSVYERGRGVGEVLGLGLGARSCRHWGSDSQQQWRKEGEVTCGVLTWSPLGPAAPPGPCVERRLGIGVGTPAVCSPGPGARRVPHGAPPPRTAGSRVGAPTFGRVSSTGNWVGPFARAPQDPVTERLLVSLGAVCWAGLAPTCGSADGREPFRRHRARGRPRRPQP